LVAGVGARRLEKGLQCDAARQTDLIGEMDDAQATALDLTDDLVVAETPWTEPPIPCS